MLKTEVSIKGRKKCVNLRFFRPDGDTTVCELKIGGVNVHPRNMKASFTGVSKRFGTDQFDRGRGHLTAIGKALNEANIQNRKTRRAIYLAYGEWAKEQKIHTKIAVDRIGVI